MNTLGVGTGGKPSAARIPVSFFFFSSVRSSFNIRDREQRVLSTGTVILCLDSWVGCDTYGCVYSIWKPQATQATPLGSNFSKKLE